MFEGFAAAALPPLPGVVLGLVTGSFLATVLIRWPQGERVAAARAATPAARGSGRSSSFRCSPSLVRAAAAGAAARGIDSRHVGDGDRGRG